MSEWRTLDDETLLARFVATRCPEQRAELVQRFYWIVEHITRRYSNRGEPSDDIAQVASIGLLGALDRYDPAIGRSFPSFAIPTASGEVRRHFRDRTWRVRVPRRIRDLTVQARSVADELRSDLGREPTPAEIADRIGVSEADVAEASKAVSANRLAPTETREHPGEDARVIELRDHHAVSADDSDDRLLLVELVRRLPPRERTIVQLCYLEGLSQEAVAARLEISQPHVSRLLRASVAWLREQMLGVDAG